MAGYPTCASVCLSVMKQLLIDQISSMSLHKQMTLHFDTKKGSSEVSKEMSLESLHHMRPRDSVQLQTVKSMYDQEIDQNRSSHVTCSFRHGSGRGQGAQSSSPAPKAQTQIVERLQVRMSFREGNVRKACQNVKIRRVIVGIFPDVNYLNRSANPATRVCSYILRLMGSTVKSRRKVVERISCLYDGDETFGVA